MKRTILCLALLCSSAFAKEPKREHFHPVGVSEVCSVNPYAKLQAFRKRIYTPHKLDHKPSPETIRRWTAYNIAQKRRLEEQAMKMLLHGCGIDYSGEGIPMATDYINTTSDDILDEGIMYTRYGDDLPLEPSTLTDTIGMEDHPVYEQTFRPLPNDPPYAYLPNGFSPWLPWRWWFALSTFWWSCGNYGAYARAATVRTRSFRTGLHHREEEQMTTQSNVDCLALAATKRMHLNILRLPSGEMACMFCRATKGEKTVPLPRVVKGRKG